MLLNLDLNSLSLAGLRTREILLTSVNDFSKLSSATFSQISVIFQ